MDIRSALAYNFAVVQNTSPIDVYYFLSSKVTKGIQLTFQ